jgi:hypothetical protein
MFLPPSIPAWRRRLGVTFFAVGLFLPWLIPVIFFMRLDGWLAAALTVAFSVGLPELLWVVAALFIGREGVRHLWRHIRVRARLLFRKLRHESK